MPNLVEVNYGRTEKSTNTDALGIRLRQASARQVREMQARKTEVRERKSAVRDP
jgi:hypothetical protein